MRTIKLKSLSLVNFKGVRSQKINFSDQVTVVCGENGTGKTTVFDAFLWLLFGKDSTGRSDSNFNIKTLDPQTGKPILHLEHSVTGVLDVDGTEIKLQRCYVENWVKPRGTTEETLQNHKTEYFLNDVKLATKKEYDAEIAAILPEDLFKMVANPFCFTSLKPDVQKSMLLDMAGSVTDDEVAQLKPEYLELLAQLSGRSLAQYAKEVAAKKRACKDELAVIPSQIDTANRLKPEAEDWVALDAELNEKKQRVADIDSQISDKSKINEQEYSRKAGIQKQIGEKKIAIANRENTIRTQANQGAHEADTKIRELEYKLRNQEADLQRKKSTLSSIEAAITSLDNELNTLRGQYRTINAEQIQYPEGAFVCPTCKRPLEVEDIEAKQRELQANFNQSKADKLRKNKEQGMAKAKQKEQQQIQRENALAEIAALEDQITTTKGMIQQERANKPEAPDVNLLISSDQEIIDLRNEIAELENQLTIDVKPVDTSELQQAKSVLNDNIQELYKRLAKREQIERAEREIEALEEKRIQNNQKLADLEKWEYTALSFQKDKDAKLLERINGLFSLVSFSFVDEQLNGGEKLTCVCTVNGTPYPDVNAAGKVNAGLDIINAICQAKGISAPIFIDNRESVNQIIPTISQVINLVVSTDKVLTIK